MVGHDFQFNTGKAGLEVEDHHHRKAQLIYVAAGIVRCEVQQGLWIVPPQSALWIPGGTRHSASGLGEISILTLFVEPRCVPRMPGKCCAISVSPLLRELVQRCVGLPAAYLLRGTESRLVAVLLDELVAAPMEKLYLPMPAETRLRTIADALTANPADRASVGQWAKRIGASGRTLSRLVHQHTGKSFGHWRQQLHIVLSLQRLSQGATVQSVAADLGYESTSSFGVMFS